MGRRELLAGMAAAAALGLSGRAAAADADPDYIVIGSGPGGGSVAANLAEAGFSVLVLEAGPPAGNKVYYDAPTLFARAAEDPKIAWHFFIRDYTDVSRHGSHWDYDGGGVHYPRASTLGGCAAHNANVLLYPEHTDWDHIMALTRDGGWHRDEMWQHWEKVRSWQPESYLPKDIVAALARFDRNVVRTLPGLPAGLADSLAKDFSGQVNDKANVDKSAWGFFDLPNSVLNGRRHGVRERLLAVAKQRSNLKIECNALVEKVVLDSTNRAIAVQFLQGENLYGACPGYTPMSEAERARIRVTVRARKEIIIAGGAFNSPQILMLSGIGPAGHLAEHGIPLNVDLPAVGTNLQDRREISVVDRWNLQLPLYQLCGLTDAPLDPCLLEWKALPGFSPLGGLNATGLRYRSSSYKGPEADMLIWGLPAEFNGFDRHWDQTIYGSLGRFWSWVIFKGYTADKAGTVRLRSADPSRPPLVNMRAFGDGAGSSDLDAMVEAVGLARAINRTRVGQGEILPGPDVPAHDLRDWIRREHYGHHASCSNPIGRPDGTAVLNSKFRVYGTTGLRVVDASAFPRIPGLFPVAAILTMAEKASRDILEAEGIFHR